MVDKRIRIAHLVEGPEGAAHRYSPTRPASGYVMVASFAGQSRFCLLAENLGHSGTNHTARIYEVLLHTAGDDLPRSGGFFTPAPGGFANVGGALPHGDWPEEIATEVLVTELTATLNGISTQAVLVGRLQPVPLPLPPGMLHPAVEHAFEAALEAAQPTGEAVPTLASVAAADVPATPEQTAEEQPPAVATEPAVDATEPAPVEYELPAMAGASEALDMAPTLVPPHADAMHTGLYGLDAPDLNPRPVVDAPWRSLVGWPEPSSDSPAPPSPLEQLLESADQDLVQSMSGGQPELAIAPRDLFTPAVEVAVPEVEIALHEAEIALHEPEIALHEPEIALHEPEIALHEPEFALHEPEFTLPEVEIALHEPEIALHEPEFALHEPEFGLHEAEHSLAPLAATPTELAIEPVTAPTFPPTDAPEVAELPHTAPPASQPGAPVRNLIPVTCVLQPCDPRATRARGSVVLDHATGTVLLTVKGLGNPTALVNTGTKRLTQYRVWLHSERTGLFLGLGACQRISGDTYRLASPGKLKLGQFENVLVSAEPEGAAARIGPSGPMLLQAPYRAPLV